VAAAYNLSSRQAIRAKRKAVFLQAGRHVVLNVAGVGLAMNAIGSIFGKANTAWRRARRWVHHKMNPQQPSVPVFIVGCQRSGTTMAMQVFERSMAATVFHTGDRRAYDRGRLLNNEIIGRWLASSRASVTVFKPMNQIQSLPQFLETFPGLRVVWMLRDFRDVVNSGVRRWDTMRDTLRQITIDPTGAGWQGEAIPDSLLEVIRAHYRDDMSLESAYALFWYLRNRFYFEFSLATNEQVRVFRYEDLVSRPAEAFAQMFAFCGCPFDPRLTNGIFASSVGRHEAPKIDASITALCEELSRAFESLVCDSVVVEEGR